MNKQEKPFLLSLSYRSSILLMLIAGGLNVFSFAPFHCWPLQIAGLMLLFSLLAREGTSAFTQRQSMWLAWSYSFAWLSTSVSWLLIALTRYGGLPMPVALLAVSLLAAFLGSYAGLLVWLAQWLRQRWHFTSTVFVLLVLPAAWTLAEWLRIWLLTGFPWVISGYAHTASPLAGFAPVFGVLGLSWLNALIAGMCASTMIVRKKAFPLVIALCLFIAGWALGKIEWTLPYGHSLSVSLLQGNVAQDMKFDPDHIVESLSLYHDMILAAPADLVVTPETALPVLSSQLPVDYLPMINAFAQQTHSAVVLGLGVHDGGQRYSNSVLGFSPLHQQRAYRYDKHHLVPFGEFVPFGFRWFVDMLHIPLGDFSSAGLMQAPMQVRDQSVMPNICYEDLFGEEIAQQLSAQISAGGPVANMLLNTSNLAWYGDSIAIDQHLQISQMRVLETGRPMLRATNTGATAVIDIHGVVIDQLLPLTRGTLHATVQGRSGKTPYLLFGNASVLLLILLSLLPAVWSGRQHRSATV
ncbi:apolipoprotein N-acyltransferase [Undibacterium sp. SXout7W]|uniref:apolipoprotein N-acyltransferase n=1 Tax=Undibacterium sp. SXout7W TaxID=3413049 RepID=UPI003BF14FFD